MKQNKIISSIKVSKLSQIEVFLYKYNTENV